MITLLVFVTTWVLGIYVPWYAFLATGLLDGVVITPLVSVAVVPFLPPTVREAVGRLYAMYAAVLVGDHALVYRSDGYELAPVADGVVHLEDGITLELAEAETHWYRLANRRLAIIVERDDQVVAPYRDDEVSIAADAGEYAVLQRTSGGYPLLTQYADYFRPGLTMADGGAVDSGRLGDVIYSPYLAQSLEGSADTTQSEDAEEKSKRDHGGDGSASARVRTYAALGALVAGGVLGLILVVVL